MHSRLVGFFAMKGLLFKFNVALIIVLIFLIMFLICQIGQNSPLLNLEAMSKLILHHSRGKSNQRSHKNEKKKNNTIKKQRPNKQQQVTLGRRTPSPGSSLLLPVGNFRGRLQENGWIEEGDCYIISRVAKSDLNSRDAYFATKN